MLREARREGAPTEQRQEIAAAVLASLATRQNLRQEWRTRSGPSRNKGGSGGGVSVDPEEQGPSLAKSFLVARLVLLIREAVKR